MIEIEKLVMENSETLKQHSERLARLETILPEIKQDIKDSKRENKESNERVERLVEKVYNKIDEICKTNGVQNVEIAQFRSSLKWQSKLIILIVSGASSILTGVVIALLLRR